jgi:hypothetical protein
MFGKTLLTTDRPLPTEFLEWQVKLRHWTMLERHGSPHAGVAPLCCVRQPGLGPGVSMHSIICGLLPRTDTLPAKTRDFRALYEDHAEGGARAVYDAGVEYLKGYYRTAADFDPTTITSLLHRDAMVVRALRANASCALLFYVFDLDDHSEEGRFRCLQLNCRAELHEDGALFDNVWWHNAVFHGKLDEQVMVRFVHQGTYDTRFGGLDPVDC